MPVITTRIEAHSINEIGPEWRIVAYRDHSYSSRSDWSPWRYLGSLRDREECSLFRSMADLSEHRKKPAISIVTGRHENGTCILFARQMPTHI